MASAFTHAFVGTIIGKTFKEGQKMPWRFWVGLAACSALPDVDVIGMRLGVPYASPFGHRGFTHSLVFATVLALIVVGLLFRSDKSLSKSWWVLLVCFFLATTSHGFLDAFTNGGLGVAFFGPLTTPAISFRGGPFLFLP